MGMKSLMCEILVDKQKKLIESFESQLKAKNEIIIKEAKRANEMFKLSYNRKLQIKEQQAEINRLRETLIRINTLLSENIRPCIFKNATTVSVPIVTLERLTAIIRHSLNREREGKND